MIININLENKTKRVARLPNLMMMDYKIKSRLLLTTLNNINNRALVKYNYIIIPISIYNIIEQSDLFLASREEKMEDGLIKVGTIGDFKCYLDIYSPSNKIEVYWDKEILRELRINSILNNTDYKEEESINLNI